MRVLLAHFGRAFDRDPGWDPIRTSDGLFRRTFGWRTLQHGAEGGFRAVRYFSGFGELLTGESHIWLGPGAVKRLFYQTTSSSWSLRWRQ